MSVNFKPKWLSLDNQNLDKISKNNESDKNKDEIIPVRCIDSKESLNKFLNLCGLRPCYLSEEYMKWSKEHIQPYNDYIRKLYYKLNPISSKNNVDYDLYKEKEYDNDKDNYYEEMYYMDEMLNEMEEEDYYYDDYYDEHYSSEDEGDVSDEYDEEGYDYVNSKFNYL